MNSCELKEEKYVQDNPIKLEKYRWVIISIYGIYSGVNFFQFLQFTIIANITERYYNVSSLAADCTGLVFMASFIILFIPVGHFIKKSTLKTTAVTSTGITVIGNIIKLFAIQKDRFFLIIISQSLCGIAQVFMLSIPSKVASTWFGSEEVSTACAIGVTWTQIGLALGALLPSLMVPNVHESAELEAGFESLFIIDNAASIGIFIVVLLFFRSSPNSPPSQSQAVKTNSIEDDKIDYIEAFRNILKERDFVLVLICFGTSYGLWNSMGITINEIYLHFFPNNGKYLGLLVLVGILSGGVLGTMIFGYILDKTHQFKKLSFCILTINCIFWICLTVAFQLRSEIGSYIFVPAFGFSSGSLMVISFEFAIETTYPNPEELSAGIMNAVIYLFAILYVIILEILFKLAGIIAGQIFMIVAYSICALLILFISSNLKRRKANLLDFPVKNYGSTVE